MNESKISVRYAKALFSLAREEDTLQPVRDDMQQIWDIIREVPEFVQLMDNPVLKSSQKAEILQSVFVGHVQDITLRFLNLIVLNNRELYLSSIARIYLDLFKKDQGIKSAILTTPKPIDSALRNIIIKMASKKLNIKIELEEKTDEKIIGGFVLRIEDQQIDASVSSHLSKIRKKLLNS